MGKAAEEGQEIFEKIMSRVEAMAVVGIAVKAVPKTMGGGEGIMEGTVKKTEGKIKRRKTIPNGTEEMVRRAEGTARGIEGTVKVLEALVHERITRTVGVLEGTMLAKGRTQRRHGINYGKNLQDNDRVGKVTHLKSSHVENPGNRGNWSLDFDD